MIDLNRYNIYKDKNGRYIAYDKITKKNKSYPRVIMEDYLQRPLLKTEEVHHKDENPENNDISNLEVLNKNEHLKLHGEKNKKYFNKKMVCPICGKMFIWTVKQQKNFKKNSYTAKRNGKNKAGPFCSNVCSGIYATNIQYDLKNKTTAPKQIIKECPICRKEFIWSVASQRAYEKGEIKLPEACCSTKCTHALRRKTEEYITIITKIKETLKTTNGNVAKAARILGIPRSTINTRIKNNKEYFKEL